MSKHFHLKRRAHGGWRIIRTSDGAVMGWMPSRKVAAPFMAAMERAVEARTA